MITVYALPQKLCRFRTWAAAPGSGDVQRRRFYRNFTILCQDLNYPGSRTQHTAAISCCSLHQNELDLHSQMLVSLKLCKRLECAREKTVVLAADLSRRLHKQGKLHSSTSPMVIYRVMRLFTATCRASSKRVHNKTHQHRVIHSCQESKPLFSTGYTEVQLFHSRIKTLSNGASLLDVPASQALVTQKSSTAPTLSEVNQYKQPTDNHTCIYKATSCHPV